MKIRVSFRSEVVIEGKDMVDVKAQFENLQLWSDEALNDNANFIEIESVENDTHGDVSEDFYNADA